jgi:hypothetical protein
MSDVADSQRDASAASSERDKQSKQDGKRHNAQDDRGAEARRRNLCLDHPLRYRIQKNELVHFTPPPGRLDSGPSARGLNNTILLTVEWGGIRSHDLECRGGVMWMTVLLSLNARRLSS